MIPYENRPFLWAAIFIVQGILPVLGTIVIRWKVKVETWFLNFIKIVVPIAGISYFVLGRRVSPGYPCNDLILFYSLVLPLFLHFLQIKTPDKTTKVLGVFLIVSHLFSQYWEIPVFIAGHLGVLGAQYLNSIDQLYLILVFYLAFKFANISIDRKTIIYLFIPIGFSAAALYSLPIGNQQMPLGYVVRGVSCFFLGKVFIDRSVL